MSDSQSSPPEFRFPEALGCAAAVGTALAAIDVLVNLYNPDPTLRDLRYLVAPAFVAAAAAGAVFLAVFLPLTRISGDAKSANAGMAAAAGMAIVTFLGTVEWFEATPYHYAQLLKILMLTNLAEALAGQAAVRFNLHGSKRMRRALIDVAGLAYAAAALSCFGWMFITSIEAAVGYERARLVEIVINAFGAFSGFIGLVVLSAAVGERLAAINPVRLLGRWTLPTFPWFMLTVAFILWRRQFGELAEFSPAIQRLGWFIPVAMFAALGLSMTRRVRTALLAPATLVLILMGVGCVIQFQAPIREALGLVRFRSDDHKIRHIIFVTSDALRSDAIGPYGGTEIRTPGLSKFAADSMVFDQALSSAPWTIPSFTAMLTGLPPEVFGGIGLRFELGSEVETLAERMEAAGYRTGAIGMNPLLLPRHGLDQGFRTYDFYPKGRRSRTLGTRLIWWLYPLYYRSDPTSAELKDMSLDWLARHRDDDFFFWLHFWDPHTPLDPPQVFMPEGKLPPTMRLPWERSMDIKKGIYHPSSEDREWIRKLYLGEVRYVDHSFGELMDGIRELGLYDDSLVIFGSDHGEEFWDHGDYGHGQSLYTELIHVPFIVKMPGGKVRGRIAQPVGTISLTPSILELAGVPFDPAGFLAPSLAPLLQNPVALIGTQPLYAETDAEVYARHRWGVRFGDFEFFAGVKPEDPVELYNVAVDPKETNDLGGNQPGEIEQGRKLLKEYRDRAASLRQLHQIHGEEALNLAPAELERLRKLGYL